jgi:hypothetical protein
MVGRSNTTVSRRSMAVSMAILVIMAVLSVALMPTLLVLADNAPPVAKITSPEDGSEFLVGVLITFDGSQSEDEDPNNITYEWNFGGQVVSGKDKAVVQRTFTSPGDVIVLLRVIDVGDRNDTAFITVHIIALNSPPVAIITSPEEGQRFLSGRSITVDGRESFDPDGGPLVYRWETNGAFTSNEPLFNILHLSNGDYNITLFVFDLIGAEDQATVNITVEVNVPPTLSDGTVEPGTGPKDLPEGFNFSVTYQDKDGDAPVDIRVKVGLPRNLVGYNMFPVDPDGTDPTEGSRYYANVALGPGEHHFVFTCRDPFYSCATVLYDGPVVYMIQEVPSPSLGAVAIVNWTEVGTVAMRAIPLPGPGPTGTVVISSNVRVSIDQGTWSNARLRLAYSTDYPVNEETTTLLWYDNIRAMWVPASGQHHDEEANTVEGQVPANDAVMAVFAELSDGDVNRPPNLAIRYDIKDAYVDEVLWFDASCSTDPDNTMNLFYWDFTDDGEEGPWVPGLRAYHVFEDDGVHRVVLKAIDGGNEHFTYENVSIRAESEYGPGPWDNPAILFMLASLLVIAFGLAIAYRLRKPQTYDDLFGKAYRPTDTDEYTQLFRKLTEEEMRGDIEDEPEDGDEESELAPDDENDEIEAEEGSGDDAEDATIKVQDPKDEGTD